MRVLLTLGLLLSAGCSEAPVIGTWQSDQKLGNGESNTLEVFGDFGGNAEIFATPKGQTDNWIAFKFDVTWEDDGDEFDFKLTCESSNCTDADEFTMECQAIEEDDGDQKLDCQAEDGSLWRDYPFDWQRNE